jgi:hypothetical protein
VSSVWPLSGLKLDEPDLAQSNLKAVNIIARARNARVLGQVAIGEVGLPPKSTGTQLWMKKFQFLCRTSDY